MGSHVMYVGEVVEARRLSDKAPIYDYYRNVTRKTEAAASASRTADNAGEIVAWKCTICGYIYEGENLPSISSAQFANTAPKISSPCTQNEHGSEDIQAAAATPAGTTK